MSVKNEKMLDSWGKVPHGVLHGVLSSLGNMKECKSVVAWERKYNGKIDTFFRGKYCAINMKPHLYFPKPDKYDPRKYLKNYTDEVPLLKNLLGPDMNMAYFYFAHFRIGACVPHTCTLDDMNVVVRQLAAVTALDISVPWCETDDSATRISATQISVLFALIAIFALSAIGTTLDVLPKLLRSARRTDGNKLPSLLNPSTIEKVAECFSVYSNFRKVMNTKRAHASETLRCIHGLRVLTMAWIILGHTFFYKNFNLGSGLFEAFKLAQNVPFQMVFNMFPAVETFVTMAGCLLTYNYLRRLEDRQGEFSYFRHILRRWWRLSPAFVAVSFMMILLPLIGSGPLWRETLAPYSEACEKFWWTNPLYIGAYVNRENMCLPHGWYLSSDFHYFIIMPLIAYILFRRPLLGLLILLALVLASVATVGILLFINDLPPIPLFIDLEPAHFNEYMNTIGCKPFTHLAPFAVGIALGYLLFKQKRRRIHKLIRIPMWLAVWVVQMAIVFGVRDWNAYDRPSVEVGVVYGALFRFLWSLCVAWTVYACATGNGGLVNRVLSFRAWIPLSRLTFLVYLIHPLVILAHTAYLREPYYITVAFTGYLYLGHLFASYALSFALTVTLESPFLALDRLITKEYYDRCDPLGHHLTVKRRATMPAISSNSNLNNSNSLKANPVYIENHIDAMLVVPYHNNNSKTRETNRSDCRLEIGKVNMAFDNAKL
ncbi:hypothetical protein BIW11_08445 [Tropilaelaps mercedesae]|uniref:Uncharacterized protein n=1 Tax=Tropilaelaps mercedesae TaxID=418985 RepID=A0A1V9XPX6_9ACAR|nr:hypothetical protein BIW11_08445 [Tropilaelaps mercedesae]